MEAFSSLLIALATFFSAFVGLFTHSAAYIAPPFVPRAPEARVLFGGDMMFDRSIRTAMERKGEDFVLACLDSVLEQADLVVANLEGPITSAASVSVGSVIGSPENFTFTFLTYTAELLARHRIRIVNIGNNHIENFGQEGVHSTIAALTAAGVDHFGDPIEQRVVYRDVNRVPLAFINFNQFARSSTKDKTIEQIRAAVTAGKIVVVYAHWGDEYVAANEYQKDRAHAFIDAGAEIVIGSHPHTVQEHEEYAGKHMYYSLGNMVFDQYWIEEVRNGLMLEVVFRKSGAISLREIPIELLRDGRTCPKPTP